MNRTLFRVAALASAVAAFSAARPTLADEIEEIIVSSPLHRGEAETVLPVNVIGPEELRRKLGATLGQTLRQEIGVNYASFGPGVGQPVIRGQAAPRVLVLANSLPVGDASGTSKDHANATEPVLAERIEVLRGPSTLLFGSGAIGGVVNVIDTRIPRAVPEAPTGAVEFRRASNGDARIGVGRLEGGSGHVAFHVDGFQRENDTIGIPGHADPDGEGERGEIANSDAEARAATLGASWVTERGFLGVSVNRLETDYGIPPGAHGHGGHEDEERAEEDHDEHDHEDEADSGEEEQVRIDLEQTRYDLHGEIEEPLPLLEKLRVGLAYTDYEHTELEGADIGTVYGNNSLDGRVEAIHDIGPFHGAIGLQFGNRDFKAVGAEAFVPGSASDSWGLFVVEDYHAEPLTWEFGLRLGQDRHDPDGGDARDFDTFSASVSALWELDEAQKLKFSLSRVQRAPAPEELFSNGVHVATQSFERGDDSLDEESSINLDLGYHLHSDRFDLRIEGFLNRYADYIYQAMTGEFFDPGIELLAPFCAAADADECLPVLQWSADDARFAGLEFELTVPLSSGFELGAFGDVVRGELDAAGDVPRLPPARVGVDIGWSGGAWDAGLRLTEALDQDDPGENEEPTEGYTALDAHLEYRIDQGRTEWVLFLRGENLLDEEIRNSTSILRDAAPEAGRTVEAGVRLSF
jgi:iron complex outermembrane receptor protein